MNVAGASGRLGLGSVAADRMRKLFWGCREQETRLISDLAAPICSGPLRQKCLSWMPPFHQRACYAQAAAKATEFDALVDLGRQAWTIAPSALVRLPLIRLY